MSKVRYVLLCEDVDHVRFVRELLKSIPGDFEKQDPNTDGQGEQFVRETFPNEVQTLRSKSYQRRLSLIVVIDADRNSLNERTQQLEQSLREQGIPPINDNEPILLVIPKWCIETWVVFFKHGNADESQNCQTYKNLTESKDYRIAARQFASDFKDPPNNWLPAMKHCAAEVSKWIEKLG